ncbi:MAG: HAMP domain-containing protein [Bacteroidales bacterium]|nr:HAMP domain-containing protein [Bacteroidales bacterium]
MFQNLRVGAKITSGFVIMIILLIIVAYVGYKGIKDVQDRVIKADDTNRLVKYALETRRAEKNYILRGGEDYLSEVDDGIQRILDQAKTTKERFDQMVNKDQMDTVVSAVKNYQRSFNLYVNTENEKIEKMGEMRIQANEVLTQIELLRQDQKDQLTSDLQARVSNKRIQERISKADDAGRIRWWFLEARKHEKEYIISEEQQWLDSHDNRMDEIIELANILKSRFRKQLNIDQINTVISALNNYQTYFDGFIDMMSQQSQLETNMLNAAGKLIVTGETARADQKDKMEKAVSRAHVLLLIFILVTIAFAFVISFTVTNSITQPLNTAVDLAEHIAVGDMDLDIHSLDRQDELGRLSQALSRMTRFLKEMAKTADMISEGDLTVKVKPQSVNDMLGNAFFIMTRSLKEMAEKANKISEGDLTVEIKPQSEKDMFGNAFRSMSENLKKQINEISQGVAVLSSTVSEITATTSELATSSTENASSISETTTTIEELKQTAQVASEKAKEISENSQKTLQVTNEGEKAVEATTEGMGRIREQMESIAGSIMKLSEQSQSIGDIMNSINDLAEQSNLLAVNASIEAAKAGEEGKGFSVVAMEVKELAEQSKQATQQVRGILTDIQKAISNAAIATEEGNKVVDAGLKQSAEAGLSIKTLANVIEEAAQSTSQIAVSAQQQSVGIDQINEAIRYISTSSTQNLESTKQLESASIGLEELGNNLKKLMEQYTVE